MNRHWKNSSLIGLSPQGTFKVDTVSVVNTWSTGTRWIRNISNSRYLQFGIFLFLDQCSCSRIIKTCGLMFQRVGVWHWELSQVVGTIKLDSIAAFIFENNWLSCWQDPDIIHDTDNYQSLLSEYRLYYILYSIHYISYIIYCIL